MRILMLLMLMTTTGCGLLGGEGKPAPKVAAMGVAMLPPPSEWFPSLVPPTAFSEDERLQILKACGLQRASVIWVQYVDLDSDRCSDAIVTLSLPPETIKGGRQWMTVTFVFHGINEGNFSQRFDSGALWFSLVTDVATSTADHDSEIRRQFAFSRNAHGMFLTLNDCSYGNTGGGGMQFIGSTTRLVNVDEVSAGRPLELSEPSDSASGAQTHPAE